MTTIDDTIPEIHYRDNGQALPGWHHSARYKERGGLPWYREMATRPTRVLAWADAVAWAHDYQRKDRYGNMASALGVIAVEGGWRGVVNYYHSNT